jgi:hypothetical protein
MSLREKPGGGCYQQPIKASSVLPILCPISVVSDFVTVSHSTKQPHRWDPGKRALSRPFFWEYITYSRPRSCSSRNSNQYTQSKINITAIENTFTIIDTMSSVSVFLIIKMKETDMMQEQERVVVRPDGTPMGSETSGDGSTVVFHPSGGK